MLPEFKDDIDGLISRAVWTV